MEGKRSKEKLSRREFLMGVPIGLAGAFMLSPLTRRLFPSKAERFQGPPEFPEDSIFAPDKERYGNRL